MFESGKYNIRVVSQCDKAKGRGLNVGCSPVKSYALLNKLPVYTPISVKERSFLDEAAKWQIDLSVVAAYGQKMPLELINMPKLGTINLHFSLLPKYRGPAPANWAIINGEKKTGITIMYVEEKIDSGDIIIQNEVLIRAEDNAGTLFRKLLEAGSDALLEAVGLIESGAVKRIKQDDNLATYAPKLQSEDLEIKWDRSPEEVSNFIRGLAPEPGAFSFLNGKLFKILECSVYDETHTGLVPPGAIINLEKERGIKVSVKNGYVYLTKLKPEGKKLMKADEYVRGNPLKHGAKFGGAK
jgi:methionyl-tRNA formyltransferase